MKNILFLILAFAASFSTVEAQTGVSLECRSCFTETVNCLNCEPTAATTELFDGMVVIDGGTTTKLYKPFYSTFQGTDVKIRDVFGNMVDFNLNETAYATMGDLQQAIANCICTSGGGGGTINSFVYNATTGTLTLDHSGGTEVVAINEVTYGTTALAGAAGDSELGIDGSTGTIYYKDAGGDWATAIQPDTLFVDVDSIVHVNIQGDTSKVGIPAGSFSYYDTGGGWFVDGSAGITTTEGADGVFTMNVPVGAQLNSYFFVPQQADDLNSAGGLTLNQVYNGVTHTNDIFDARLGVYNAVNSSNGFVTTLQGLGVNVVNTVTAPQNIRSEFGSVSIGVGLRAAF